MAIIAGTGTLGYNDLYQNWTEIPGGLSIGQLMPGAEGKYYRFCLVGASNLVTGNMIQSSAVDTQFSNMAVLAASISTAGLQTVTVTNGTTSTVANYFDGGSVSVYTTPDLGSEYTILSSKPDVVTSGNAITLTLDRPLRTAWTTSTKVNMRRSPWSGVIQQPTTVTGTPAGVAMFANTAAQYSWIQTHGVAAALSDATSIVVGSGVTVSTTAAGAVTLHVAGYQVTGTAMQAAASGHCIGVQLTID